MGSVNPLDAIGLALGAGFSSGLNLYATVATLGLLERFHMIHLPAALHILSNPIVIGLALALYAVEFLADKIPYVDTVWDVVHTFIRPPAGALLACGAMWGLPPALRWCAALLAGSVALAAHGAKASARAAANTSPEPFTNWTLSLGEDVLAVWLTWMAVTHPVWTVGVVVVLLVISIFLVITLYRFLRKRVQRVFPRPAAQT